MPDSVLLRVRRDPVFRTDRGSLYFFAGMTIDADGSPHAYHPVRGCGLDDLANAGRPGNWYGVVTDRFGNPVVQSEHDPAPGFFVSATAYEDPAFHPGDPRRYLDSEKVPYMVVPGPLRNAVAPVVLGCRAVATYRGRTVEALVGDIGPATHLGEGSIALAEALGIPSNPRTGGESRPVIRFEFWPGVPAVVNGVEYRLQSP